MKSTKAVRLKHEMQQQGENLARNVASVALAVECLEEIFNEKRWRWPWSPILRKDELMERLKAKVQERAGLPQGQTSDPQRTNGET